MYENNGTLLPPPFQPPAAPPKQTYTARDRVLIFGALAFGWLLASMFLFYRAAPRVGVPLSLMLGLALFFWYMGKPLSAYNTAGMLVLAYAMLLSLTFALHAERTLYGFNLLAVSALSMMGLMLATDYGGLDSHRPNVLMGGVKGGFSLACLHWEHPIRAAAVLKGNKKTSKILLGLVIALPFLLFALALLSSADKQFQIAVERLIDGLFGDLRLQLIRLIWVGVVAFLVYSFLYGLKRNLQPRNGLTDSITIHEGDGIVFAVIIVSLCLLYALFAYVQFAYLFAATPPDGFTFSEYARRGFFELTAIAALNITLALLAVTYTKRTGRGVRVIGVVGTVLMALTLIILASAVYRMWLYVAVGGLTRLRLQVFWGECVMLLLIIVAIIKLWRPQLRVFRTMAGIIMACYLALNVAGLDNTIAHYNVAMHNDERLEAIDYDYMGRHLSVDAIPALKKLPPSERRDQMIVQIQSHHKQDGFWSWSVQW